jgi:hypothetical protein
MEKQDLELYTDYLISCFCPATAAGLSYMVDGSYDHVTRFLSNNEFTSKKLRLLGWCRS